MELSANLTLHNKFHLELRDAKSGKLKQEAWAYNLVLDTYYSALSNKDMSLDLDYISLGTGLGTPAVTDTDLFHRIAANYANSRSAVHNLSSTQNVRSYSRTISTTFTESDAIGLLTEIGISTQGWQYYRLWTHAMLTDSEGHTITIEKTDTDRLTVTATLYLTIAYPAGILPLEVVKSNFLLSFPAAEYVKGDSSDVPWAVNRGFGMGGSGNQSLAICVARNTPCTAYTFETTTSNITGGTRAQATRVLSTSWNQEYTYQIMGISTSIGVIPLPNHSLFPPIDLELEAVGDGSSTGFNFGIAELMDTIEVEIDGVIQPANSYTWNRKDFNIRQAWISQHGDYLIKHPTYYYSSYSYAASPIIPWQSSSSRTDDPVEYVYDFGSPYQVNALATSGANHVQLLYSNDGSNWTQAAQITNGSYPRTTVTFNTVSARYWKTVWPNGCNASDTMMSQRVVGAFDYVSNQLEFNSAPANGAVIKIRTKSEYPIKNSNWIIDQVVHDLIITRGDNV